MKNWTGTEWYTYFLERAGYLEYNEGLSRPDAQRKAWDEIQETKKRLMDE